LGIRFREGGLEQRERGRRGGESCFGEKDGVNLRKTRKEKRKEKML